MTRESIVVSQLSNLGAIVVRSQECMQAGRYDCVLFSKARANEMRAEERGHRSRTVSCYIAALMFDTVGKKHRPHGGRAVGPLCRCMVVAVCDAAGYTGWD
jgi:hypothetical protein